MSWEQNYEVSEINTVAIGTAQKLVESTFGANRNIELLLAQFVADNSWSTISIKNFGISQYSLLIPQWFIDQEKNQISPHVTGLFDLWDSQEFELTLALSESFEMELTASANTTVDFIVIYKGV